jgi:hypothetical protein
VPLRTLLEADKETVQDLVLAAEERYWEGLELMLQGRIDAGIYLMGYTSEMLLKTACFFFDGARPADLTKDRLSPTRRLGASRFPAVKDEFFHSLKFWATALEHKRATAGRPLAPPLLAALHAAVGRLYDIWWVEMRYRPRRATPADSLALYEDVSWMRANHMALWS